MLGPTSRRVVVGALAIVTLALVLAAVALLSRQGAVAPITITAPTPGALPSPAPPTPAPSPTPSEIRVFVSGAVGSPGVYSMQPDDRVADAIEAAGGALEGADLARLNLAMRVRDEAQYHVPVFGEAALVPTPPPPQADTQPEGPGASGGLVDLNSAPAALLESLPGIGPALAAAIVDYRTVNGPFLTVEDVVNVPRIGPSIYDKIRDLVTVAGPR